MFLIFFNRRALNRAMSVFLRLRKMAWISSKHWTSRKVNIFFVCFFILHICSTICSRHVGLHCHIDIYMGKKPIILVCCTSIHIIQLLWEILHSVQASFGAGDLALGFMQLELVCLFDENSWLLCSSQCCYSLPKLIQYATHWSSWLLNSCCSNHFACVMKKHSVNIWCSNTATCGFTWFQVGYSALHGTKMGI